MAYKQPTKKSRKRKCGKWNKSHGAPSRRDMQRMLRMLQKNDPNVKWDPS